MIDNEKLEQIKIKAREEYVPILQDDSLRLIETILEIKKPLSILEVGTAVGFSSLTFSKHLGTDGKIITLELNENMVGIARKNIESTYKKGVQVRKGTLEDLESMEEILIKIAERKNFNYRSLEYYTRMYNF